VKFVFIRSLNSENPTIIIEKVIMIMK